MSKVECREVEERRELMRVIQARQNELLNVIGGGDAEASLQASEELKLLAKAIKQSMNNEEQKQLASQRSRKLMALKNRLQENADHQFADFREEFGQVRRPVRKQQLLTDRLYKEEMYFNPILNKLGQIRLVRSLKKQKTGNSSNIKAGDPLGQSVKLKESCRMQSGYSGS